VAATLLVDQPDALTIGANPLLVRRIHGNAGDVRCPEKKGRISHFVGIDQEACLPVGGASIDDALREGKTRQPALGPDPDLAAAILHHRVHIWMRQVAPPCFITQDHPSDSPSPLIRLTTMPRPFVAVILHRNPQLVKRIHKNRLVQIRLRHSRHPGKSGPLLGLRYKTVKRLDGVAATDHPQIFTPVRRQSADHYEAGSRLESIQYRIVRIPYGYFVGFDVVLDYTPSPRSEIKVLGTGCGGIGTVVIFLLKQGWVRLL
jgi:hypothetical protein